MTLREALKILDNLAGGYHPDTGKLLPNNSVCNTRSVIRALQMSIDFIKNHDNSSVASIPTKTATRKNKSITVQPIPYEEIDLEDVLTDDKLFEYLYKFKEEGFNPTVARLGKCLVGTQAKSIYQYVKDFPFYGLLEGVTTYNEIKPIISNFFEKYEAKINDEYLLNHKPWEEIDFFEQETFNELTDFTIKQLTETIVAIPIKRSLANITAESMLIARKIYPRAYEPWEQQENSLLLKTLRYTNNLELLSSIFKRGPGAIRSQGQRLLYQIAQSAQSGK